MGPEAAAVGVAIEAGHLHRGGGRIRIALTANRSVGALPPVVVRRDRDFSASKLGAAHLRCTLKALRSPSAPPQTLDVRRRPVELRVPWFAGDGSAGPNAAVRPPCPSGTRTVRELADVLLSSGEDARTGPGARSIVAGVGLVECARDMRPLGEDAEGDGGQNAPRGDARRPPRTSAVVFALSDSAHSLVHPSWWCAVGPYSLRIHEGAPS